MRVCITLDAADKYQHVPATQGSEIHNKGAETQMCVFRSSNYMSFVEGKHIVESCYKRSVILSKNYFRMEN